jgi:hypothetical protein
MSRSGTVHYLCEKMCKYPANTVGRAAERYSEGPGYKSESRCTFFSPCDNCI